MKAGDIAPDVLQFVADNIDSVPHIEALLLLYEQAEQTWTVELIAARLYVSRGTAAAILGDLERRKLADVRTGSGPPTYVYDSAWDPGGELMMQVASTYKKHLARMATFIHSKASRSVREFARAFDLKKEN